MSELRPAAKPAGPLLTGDYILYSGFCKRRDWLWVTADFLL